MRTRARALGAAGRIGACVALASCAQIAGIEDTTGSGGDGGTPGSLLAFERTSIGATVVQAPLSTDGLTPPTFFVDGAGVAGLANGSAWTSDQVATAVLFHLPDYPQSIPRMFQLPTSQIHGFFNVLERPGAAAPPTGAQVTLALTLPSAAAATEQFELFDIGAWSALGLSAPAGATTISETTPYASFSSQTGRPLDAIGDGDAILGLRYTGGQLTAAVDLPGFAQTGSDTITGTLVALPGAQQLNVAVTPADATMRFAAVMPAMTGTPSVAWSLVAAPGAAIASNAGPQLQGATPPVTDTVVTAAYDNPFAARGWHPVFSWVIHVDRSYTPTVGALAGKPIALTARLFTLREPGAGTAADTATLDAGLPTQVTLGATPLTTDGAALTDDPTTPLTVTFTADHPTDTLYQVQVLESALAMDGSVTTTSTFEYLGDHPTFTLPANTLVAGHTYRLRAGCISGSFTAVASGDLTQRSLPFSLGVLDSAVFSVGAPQ